MQDLGLAIAELHPELPADSYEVRDDGNGPYIYRWPDGVPWPQDAELAAAVRARKTKDADKEARRKDAEAKIRASKNPEVQALKELLGL